MYVRCASCKVSGWIKPIRDLKTHELKCESCGNTYKARASKEFGTEPEIQHAVARAFAEKHQIDLPSAYTVLLGVAPLEGMREPAGAKPKPPAAEERAPDPTIPVVTGGRQRTRYDPGFRRAVEQGYLTVQQATQRGKRDAYAAMIASRHRLPVPVAFRIADNETSVNDALRERERGQRKLEAAPRPRRFTLSGPQWAVLVILGAAMVGGIGAYGRMLWQQQVERSRKVQTIAENNAPAEQPAPEEPKDAETVALSAVEVDTDEQGNVVRVVGPDPRSVLVSYCERTGLQPLKLAPVSSRFSRARLGIFRDFNQLESYFAIRIRRDVRSRRWVVGDGRAPIEATPISDVPEGDDPVPVQ